VQRGVRTHIEKKPSRSIEKRRNIAPLYRLAMVCAPCARVCTLLWGRAAGNGEYRTCTCIYNPQYPSCDITVDSLVSIYLSAHADAGFAWSFFLPCLVPSLNRNTTFPDPNRFASILALLHARVENVILRTWFFFPSFRFSRIFRSGAQRYFWR